MCPTWSIDTIPSVYGVLRVISVFAYKSTLLGKGTKARILLRELLPRVSPMCVYSPHSILLCYYVKYLFPYFTLEHIICTGLLACVCGNAKRLLSVSLCVILCLCWRNPHIYFLTFFYESSTSPYCCFSNSFVRILCTYYRDANKRRTHAVLYCTWRRPDLSFGLQQDDTDGSIFYLFYQIIWHSSKT